MEDTAFIIRLVTERDRNALSALLREDYRNPDTGLTLEVDYIRERADELLENSLNEQVSHQLFLGVVDNMPVALAYVMADEKRGGFLVDDLYTDPEYEGRGIATELLGACEDFVQNQGAEEIHLNVIADDEKVKRFYAKRGWVKQTFNVSGCDQETESKAEFDPHAYVPTYVLKKFL